MPLASVVPISIDDAANGEPPGETKTPAAAQKQKGSKYAFNDEAEEPEEQKPPDKQKDSMIPEEQREQKPQEMSQGSKIGEEPREQNPSEKPKDSMMQQEPQPSQDGQECAPEPHEMALCQLQMEMQRHKICLEKLMADMLQPLQPLEQRDVSTLPQVVEPPLLNVLDDLNNEDDCNDFLAIAAPKTVRMAPEAHLTTNQAKKSRLGDEKLMLSLSKSKVAGVKEQYQKIRKKTMIEPMDPKTACFCTRLATRLVEHPNFEYTLSIIIILCGIAIGIESDWRIQHFDQERPGVFGVLDLGFNLIFTTELLLRLTKEGLRYWSWHNSSFSGNVMDSTLVFISVVDECINFVVPPSTGLGNQMGALKLLRMLRLVRVVRLLRVLRFFSELRAMVNGIISCLKSLVWAFVLMYLVIFMFGVILMQFVQAQLEITGASTQLLHCYGSMPKTTLSMYMAISGGIDWNDCAYPLMEIKDIGLPPELLIVLFSVFVFVTVFCGLNIITGVFVDNAKAIRTADDDAMHNQFLKENRIWIKEVADLFARITEASVQGSLAKDDFLRSLEDEKVQTLFKKMGIPVESTNSDDLWVLFDQDESGSMDQEEFALGIRQFHGAAKSIDVFKIRKDIKNVGKQVLAVTEGLQKLGIECKPTKMGSNASF